LIYYLALMNSTGCVLLNLTDDVIIEIMFFLIPLDIAKLSRTCNRMLKIGNNPVLWTRQFQICNSNMSKLIDEKLKLRFRQHNYYKDPKQMFMEYYQDFTSEMSRFLGADGVAYLENIIKEDPRCIPMVESCLMRTTTNFSSPKFQNELLKIFPLLGRKASIISVPTIQKGHIQFMCRLLEHCDLNGHDVVKALKKCIISNIKSENDYVMELVDVLISKGITIYLPETEMIAIEVDLILTEFKEENINKFMRVLQQYREQ